MWHQIRPENQYVADVAKTLDAVGPESCPLQTGNKNDPWPHRRMPEKAHRCGRHALAGNAPACGPELQPVVKPEGSGYRLVMMISGASHRRAKVRVAAWAVMKAMIACQTLFRDGSLRFRTVGRSSESGPHPNQHRLAGQNVVRLRCARCRKRVHEFHTQDSAPRHAGADLKHARQPLVVVRLPSTNQKGG